MADVRPLHTVPPALRAVPDPDASTPAQAARPERLEKKLDELCQQFDVLRDKHLGLLRENERLLRDLAQAEIRIEELEGRSDSAPPPRGVSTTGTWAK